jgi:hypothetical protein
MVSEEKVLAGKTVAPKNRPRGDRKNQSALVTANSSIGSGIG